MPVTIVVGGQYGSEGKGKVAALVGASLKYPWHVRCGGPNSGHSVTIQGKDVVLRQVPSCVEPRKAIFCLAAGCAVDVDILVSELELLHIDREQIIVDPRAVIVGGGDRDSEKLHLSHIGSTGSGTGSAMMRRMSRSLDCLLAKDCDVLKNRCRVETVAPLLHRCAGEGGDIVVEGSQGFGLSLLHGPYYPYVTSRDTTAAGFAMEAGLSPRMIDKIILVVRTFPIRVGGSSGPLAEEISWDEIARLSGAPTPIPEFTSVTRRLRRVARFDMELAKIACQYNRPTSIALMGADRLEYANTGAGEIGELTAKSRTFMKDLESATDVPIEFVGTGFGTFDAIRIAKPIHFELSHV